MWINCPFIEALRGRVEGSFCLLQKSYVARWSDVSHISSGYICRSRWVIFQWYMASLTMFRDTNPKQDFAVISKQIGKRIWFSFEAFAQASTEFALWVRPPLRFQKELKWGGSNKESPHQYRLPHCQHRVCRLTIAQNIATSLLIYTWLWDARGQLVFEGLRSCKRNSWKSFFLRQNTHQGTNDELSWQHVIAKDNSTFAAQEMQYQQCHNTQVLKGY